MVGVRIKLDDTNWNTEGEGKFLAYSDIEYMKV